MIEEEKTTEQDETVETVVETEGDGNTKFTKAKLTPERVFTKPWVVALCAIFCCMLWGSAFPCVKTGYKLFEIDTNSPASLMLFAGVRFALAGVLVISFGSIQKRRFLVPRPRNIWRVLLVGLVQTDLHYPWFYIG